MVAIGETRFEATAPQQSGLETQKTSSMWGGYSVRNLALTTVAVVALASFAATAAAQSTWLEEVCEYDFWDGGYYCWLEECHHEKICGWFACFIEKVCYRI